MKKKGFTKLPYPLLWLRLLRVLQESNRFA